MLSFVDNANRQVNSAHGFSKASSALDRHSQRPIFDEGSSSFAVGTIGIARSRVSVCCRPAGFGQID